MPEQNKVMNVRIKLRSDTQSAWEAVQSTFVPLDGEVILYKNDNDGSQTNYYKVGDGHTTLENLTFWYGPREKIATTLDTDDPAYDGDALVTADLANTIEGASFERATTLDKWAHDFNPDGVVDAGTLTDFMTWTLDTEDPEYTGIGFVEAGVIASRIDGVREDLVLVDNRLTSGLDDANDRIDSLYDRLSGLGEAAFSDVATGCDLDPDDPAYDGSRLVPAFLLNEVVSDINERIEGLGDLDALHFKGIYDPGDIDFTPQNGDVIMTNDGKEYLYTNGAWHLFGDENAYVIKEQGKSLISNELITKIDNLTIATDPDDPHLSVDEVVSVGFLNQVIGEAAEYDVAATLDASDAEYKGDALVPASVITDYTATSYNPGDLHSDTTIVGWGALEDLYENIDGQLSSITSDIGDLQDDVQDLKDKNANHVVWSQIQLSGTKIAQIQIDDNAAVDVYVPNSGQVSVNPVISSGVKIAEITANGETKSLYAPQAGESTPPYEYLSQMTGAAAPDFDGDVIMDGGIAPV